MKYSIIIPIYNQERYLDECIKSVLKCNRKDVELILVNDGSKDASLDICKKYKEKYSNIILIDKENTGAMDSWIKGVEVATGDYIGFLDSDDLLKDCYFDSLDKYVKEEYDIIMFDYEKIYKNTSVKTKVNDIDYGLFKGNRLNDIKSSICQNERLYSFYRWNKVVKSNIIKENIKEIDCRVTYFEDHIIGLLNLLSCKSLYYLNKSLYKYRMRISSVSHSVNNRVFTDNKLVENNMINILRKNNYDESSIYHEHIYFLFQYARWYLKSQTKENRIRVYFRDILNTREKERKFILLLYKLRLKRTFKFINNLRHSKNGNLNNYYE